MVYLCAVLDLCGKMVPAYRIGGDMTASLVTDTVRDACKKRRPLIDESSTAAKGHNTHPKHTLT